jgi:glycosyltransferase involved in cell wall biosynthesis
MALRIAFSQMNGSAMAVVVCPVVPHPPQTGGQKRTLRLLEAISRAGATPHIVTADQGAEAQREALEARGWCLHATIERPPSLRSRARQHLARHPSPYWTGVSSRLRALTEQRPAWVQLEHGNSARYIAQLAQVRTVLSLHNLDSQMIRSSARVTAPGIARAREELRWRAMRATERWAAPKPDLVLCVSEQERSALERLGAATMLVPNGVDAELLALPVGPPPGEEVLFFGQLRFEPNAHGIARFLAEGWPLVAAARPAARLRIVGEGADAQLRRIVAQMRRVELVGLVSDIAPELARAAVVVVPVWEGAGTRLKVIESLAAARPVVGTALGVGGIGFVDRRHGSVADEPADIARAVAELLGAPERRAAAGREGRTLAQRFEWTRVLAPLEELYRTWAGCGTSEAQTRR